MQDQPLESFAAHTRVLVDQVGRGTRARGIRRAFLVERHSGRMLELQTAFLDHEFGLKVANTQAAVLVDLAFFHEWCLLRQKLNLDWTPPANRAANNLLPLSEREIGELARWSQYKAKLLAAASQRGDDGIDSLPLGEVVSSDTRNRRLRYISKYLQWLVVSLATDEDISKGGSLPPEVRRRKVQRAFEKRLIARSKTSTIFSLAPEESAALRKVLSDGDIFPDEPIGIRDRLIIELLSQGMRSGEVLKVRCSDVVEAYPLSKYKTISVIAIVRRANDIDDVRTAEPAVKTLEGLLPIPQRLARELTAYVRGPRRTAVDAAAQPDETSYLFVNHTGRHAGRPISQRNISRIVAKLKGLFDLPEDLHPHSLRHTHFTELADSQHRKGRSDQQIRALLIHRGRWDPQSKEPARYTARTIVEQSAEYVEARDAEVDAQ